MTVVRDPLNPTITEIREWAYSGDGAETCQDWHDALCVGDHTQLYLDLVADRACLKRMLFLDLLYNTVRCWLGENPTATEVRVSLDEIATKARDTGCYYLLKFAEDVAAARNAGQDYDLDFWFEGGYRCRIEKPT